ncbi:MAG: cysteine--tRNA ligase [Deltaproteobacteria bacterium]|nr:MAG: cysteine--tRNA ligase [Deltaproteobacteria bacterium]
MQLYNTTTRTKEDFTPLIDNHVRMYVCGITAYDYCHIGHARSCVVFDVLYRYLHSKGYQVTFVRNFTDVDDKIITRAVQENTTSKDIAETYIQAFYDDMDQLGIKRPDVEPKATEHIPEMIELVELLIEKGHAYATAKGDVYYRVRTFDSYGRLSGRQIEELQSGARVAPGEDKEDPLDFALWKSAKPGEPFWESPWGQGRPGWHLECSAMSKKYLDIPFDIHGGGQDLSFPHHENERAQSEAAYGVEFARFWIHNGFVRINAEKMSKSLGNFTTIRTIFESYLPEVLRFFLLTKHYRSPLDYSTDALEEAEKGIRRIYTAKSLLESELNRSSWKQSSLPQELVLELTRAEEGFVQAMEDDLNTAGALGHVFTLIRLANRILEHKTWKKSEQARPLFQRILDNLNTWGEILGILTQESHTLLTELRQIRAQRKGIDQAQVLDLMDQRAQARRDKDFAKADTIREALAAMNVTVQDTPQGVIWDVI